MQEAHNNRDRTGAPLEWSSAIKAFFILLITGVIYLAYDFWGRWILGQPSTAELVNRDGLVVTVNWLDYILVITATLIVIVQLVPARHRDSIWLEHLGAQFYSLSLSMIGYFSGTLALSTGVVLAGAPVFGFMFLRPAPVLTALGVAISLQAGLTLAQTQGMLPYAPMVASLTRADGSLSGFWVATFYLFALPHFLVLTTLSWFILTRWRRREEEIRQLSMTDPLTNLPNRRAILAHLRREADHCSQQHWPLSVIMVDLDWFKDLNDSWGHAVGDRALAAASTSLGNGLRQNDRIGRYGGEEFLLVLNGTDYKGAQILAERLRATIAQTRVGVDCHQPVTLSASFGIYCREPGDITDLNEMVHKADEALYEAKAGGRNQVVTATAGDGATAVA